MIGRILVLNFTEQIMMHMLIPSSSQLACAGGAHWPVSALKCRLLGQLTKTKVFP